MITTAKAELLRLVNQNIVYADECEALLNHVEDLGLVQKSNSEDYEWRLTDVGKTALAEYDAHFVTVPRAALTMLLAAGKQCSLSSRADTETLDDAIDVMEVALETYVGNSKC